MATSRDAILGKLRAVQQPALHIESIEEHLHVVPPVEMTREELVEHFAVQAAAQGCMVHRPASEAEALAVLADLIGGERVLAWDAENIPLRGVDEFVTAHRADDPRDPSVRVGITGADAGLAATGSLLLVSGRGKPRVASLLPPVHIAVMRAADVVPDFESWAAAQREQGLAAMRKAASVMIISGPSRTADIAMQLIMGMHGPGEVHVILMG